MRFIKFLKSISFVLALCCATQLQAADVDLAAAQNVARSFLNGQVVAGRMKAQSAANLKLVKAEASVAKPAAVDYYIFNTEKSYVVVAGDDKVPEILIYGTEGALDVDNIPPAMQWLLNKYKFQIDGIKAGTRAPIDVPSLANVTPVAPLVTANWDQSAPYNNQCPTSGSRHAVTGCPATSLSMCYYKWKWPKTFPACAAIDGSNSGGLSAAALPEREADWDNIIDEYTGPTNTSYTSAQANAVAWLMRYAGQCIPDYMYGTSASGANDPEIYQGVLNMGYTDAQYKLLTELVESGYSYSNSEQYYTDAQWNEWMLAELHAGRPIEYLAYDISGYSVSGHAFNVFGVDASGKYYVNWGWSGDSNGYCTLHNFTTSTGATGQSGSYVFKYGEAMIIGIEPPAGALGPAISASPDAVTFNGYVNRTYTETLTVKAYNLTENVTATLTGANCYSIDTNSLGTEGGTITVTYAPTTDGETTATLTLSSEGAETVTVPINGTALPQNPTLVVSPENMTFMAGLSATKTLPISITGLFLTGDVTLTLNDANGVFTLAQTTIPLANISETEPVNVDVSFMSAVEGNFSGTVTVASPGAPSVTVNLTGKANDGGTASDPYLNIAKYETIDDAGWDSSIQNLYKYTEDPANGCAWLTVSNYGVNVSANTQKWFNPNTIKNADGTWNATDVFSGSSYYFGSSTARYANWTEDYQDFYVTNCTQVRQLAYNSGSSYPLIMTIYECTENADGTLSVGSTSVDTKQSSVYGAVEVITSKTLDETKIYKVRIYNDYSRLYEIGFQTPLNVPSIKATPDDLTIRTLPGQSATATISVIGKLLTENATITLNDENNVFEVSATSLNVNDVLNGTEFTVTFSSEVEQTYTGTITITSGDLTTTVNLTGVSAQRGNATDDYLNIAKYETINEAGATVTGMQTIYDFVNEGDDGWLVMSTYGAYTAVENQKWISSTTLNSYSTTWAANDIFKGNTFYFGGSGRAVYGSGTMSFNVTNCTQVKVYDSGVSTSGYKATLTIYECTENADGSVTPASTPVDTKVSSVSGVEVITSNELDASKIYMVQVQGGGSYPDLYEVAFKTPLRVIGEPTIVSAEPTATTADVAWTEGENNESWNLRYRPYVEQTAKTWDFEDAAQLNEFTLVDVDGDGHNWTYFNNEGLTTGLMPANSGYGIVYSASYYKETQTILYPDNWLISPVVNLDGKLSFYACGQDADYADEVFGVYVCTGNSTNPEDFVQVGADKTATAEYELYEFDLSEYQGQGRFAIVHHNVNDMFVLKVDDIAIGEVVEEYPWVDVADLDDTNYTITDLTPETTYEVQVQGVDAAGATSKWTASTLFTTLAEEKSLITELYMVGEFNDWNQLENGGRKAFELNDDNIFEMTTDLELVEHDNGEKYVEFKLITPDENAAEGWRWFGGVDEYQNNFFLVTEDLFGNEIELVNGANFRITEEGNYSFYVMTATEAETVLGIKADATVAGIAEPLVMVIVKNTVTGVNDLKANANDNNLWYNIHGMVFKQMPTEPGVYIHNGKKVIIRK